ncbi:MAG: tRNA (guanosine(37)-N1)-methyltransferase TrmD [Actinomycetota bacterium]|nr:tRNA (guanosine(37)-N1)-methyltransferase TrmD [Actinomycetota bacterium]
MRLDVITIFPHYLEQPLAESLIGKAREKGILDIRVHDLRAHAVDTYGSVDDEPYGGGAGMVMRPEPWFAAVESIDGWKQAHRILLTPAGRRLDQQVASTLATQSHLILLCGRYEGIDERVSEGLILDEISIGDYVLAGGEAAALVLIEATTRLVDGVVKERESIERESFSAGLLDYPVYTRPAEFRGMKVPDVLLSGHHAEIERWRSEQQQQRTADRRPDLLPPDLPD